MSVTARLAVATVLAIAVVIAFAFGPIAAAALTIGIAVGALVRPLTDLPSGRLRSSARGRRVASAPTGAEEAGPSSDVDRGVLVEACVKVRDVMLDAQCHGDRPLVPVRAMGDLLGGALERVGVRPVDPVGTPFYVEHHVATGTTPAPRVEMDGIVAETDRLGYTDRGALLRQPEVMVHRWIPSTDRGAQSGHSERNERAAPDDLDPEAIGGGLGDEQIGR